MSAKKSNSTEKKYYKIREVSELTGLPLPTLRFWESKFTVINPKRNMHGTRFYTPEDVEKIRMVAYLVKTQGMKLAAAEEQLRHNSSGVSRKYLVVERLKGIREQLGSLLASLDARN